MYHNYTKKDISDIKKIHDVRSDWEIVTVDYINDKGKKDSIDIMIEYELLDYILKKQNEIEELEKENEEYKRRFHHALGYMENCFPEPDYNYVHKILEGRDKINE